MVLAAGTLRSPQLLMLSGIGPAAHLRERGTGVARDLPGVGDNLHDHPVITPTWPVTEGTTLLDAQDEGSMRDYGLLRRGPLASYQQAGAMIRTSGDEPAPDMQLSLALIGLGSGLTPLPEPAVTCALSLLTPRSRGSVRLSSPDAADAPLVDPPAT